MCMRGQEDHLTENMRCMQPMCRATSRDVNHDIPLLVMQDIIAIGP